MSPISVGKVPLKKFSPISKNPTDRRFPNSVGNVPVISLIANATVSKATNAPSSVGKVPTKLLVKKSRKVKLLNSPISVGIDPSNRFEPMSISSRDVGIDRIMSCTAPVNLLSSEKRVFSAPRFPEKGGSVPSKLFPRRKQVSRLGNNPRDDGTVPVRKLEAANKSVNETWLAKSGKVPERMLSVYRRKRGGETKRIVEKRKGK